MTNQYPNHRSKPLSPERRAHLRHLIERDGIDAVAAAMGASVPTVGRLAAGAGCYSTSLTLACLWLDAQERRAA
jgi:hypothetical protein